MRSAYLQALTILNTQECNQAKLEKETPQVKEKVQQDGSITKDDVEKGDFNLADYVLEKQTRIPKEQQLFQGFFSVYRVGHFLNLFNQADQTHLEIISAEHGQVIYQNNLSE